MGQAACAAEADAERLRRQIAQAVRGDAFLDLPTRWVQVPAGPPRRRRGAGPSGLPWGPLPRSAAMVALRARDGQHPPAAVAGEPADGVPTDKVSQSDIPQSVFFAQSELAEKTRLLAGMQDFLPADWRGSARQGREVQLGLLPDAASGTRPALVGHARRWRSAWSSWRARAATPPGSRFGRPT